MPHVNCMGGVSHSNTGFFRAMRRVGSVLNTGPVTVRVPVNTRRGFGNMISLVGVGTVL